MQALLRLGLTRSLTGKQVRLGLALKHERGEWSAVCLDDMPGVPVQACTQKYVRAFASGTQVRKCEATRGHLCKSVKVSFYC